MSNFEDLGDSWNKECLLNLEKLKINIEKYFPYLDSTFTRMFHNEIWWFLKNNRMSGIVKVRHDEINRKYIVYVPYALYKDKKYGYYRIKPKKRTINVWSHSCRNIPIENEEEIIQALSDICYSYKKLLLNDRTNKIHKDFKK